MHKIESNTSYNIYDHNFDHHKHTNPKLNYIDDKHQFSFDANEEKYVFELKVKEVEIGLKSNRCCLCCFFCLVGETSINFVDYFLHPKKVRFVKDFLKGKDFVVGFEIVVVGVEVVQFLFVNF